VNAPRNSLNVSERPNRYRYAAHDTGGLKGRALSAARTVLADAGVEKLSLRAIAQEAEIGIASMYHYFANKEQLLLNLASGGFEDLRRAILRGQTDPQFDSPMRGGARAVLGFAEDHPALYSLMFSDRLLARHEALRAAERRAYAAYEAAVCADPRVPSPHQESVAAALWALGRGLAVTLSSYPDGKLPAGLAKQLTAGIGYLIDHSAAA
jgi:AcrR family transcriptional regulator